MVLGSGTSPLSMSHITSVSVGSVYQRSRYDESLDSYQEHDLERWVWPYITLPSNSYTPGCHYCGSRNFVVVGG